MSFRGFVPANTNQVKNLLSTGVLKGGTVTTSNVVAGVSGDVTVSDSIFRFVDNHANQSLPNFKGDKVFSESTLVGVDLSTLVKIVVDADLVVTAEVFTGLDTAAQRRDRVTLAIIGVAGNVVKSFSNIVYDSGAILRDTMDAVGFTVIQGLALTSNGANLSFDRESGTEFTPFSEGHPADPESPITIPLAAVEPVTFFEVFRDGSGGFNFVFGSTAITPGVFDDNSPAAPTAPDGPVNATHAQIFRIYEVAGSFGLLYGQQTYNSISAAEDAVDTEIFIVPPVFIGTSFRGHIVVRGAATDLSLAGDATFFQPESPFVGVRDI